MYWIEGVIAGSYRVEFGRVVVLHLFLSLACPPICLRSARDIGGLSCVGIDVPCLGGCIGHMLVAMSWYSWMIVMTCAAAKFV